MSIHLLIEHLGPIRGPALADAARSAGLQVSTWDDAWWDFGRFPVRRGQTVLFHGSLGNAVRILRERPWSPGAFCDVSSLRTSVWSEQIPELLVNRNWTLSTVAELCADPGSVTARIGGAERIFVRPDSPLKAFSGRVLDTESVTPQALDHGFYYEDLQLPILVAPERSVGREWRFVIARGEPVTASGYLAQGRQTTEQEIPSEVRSFATQAAQRLQVADPMFVLDVAEVDGGLGVLELNPFSGADLYGCDRALIVDALVEVLG